MLSRRNRRGQFRSHGWFLFQFRKVYSGLILSSVTFQASLNLFCTWILSQCFIIALAFGTFYWYCHHVLLVFVNLLFFQLHIVSNFKVICFFFNDFVLQFVVNLVIWHFFHCWFFYGCELFYKKHNSHCYLFDVKLSTSNCFDGSSFLVFDLREIRNSILPHW